MVGTHQLQGPTDTQQRETQILQQQKIMNFQRQTSNSGK
jgi:hypothetical protein